MQVLSEVIILQTFDETIIFSEKLLLININFATWSA